MHLFPPETSAPLPVSGYLSFGLLSETHFVPKAFGTGEQVAGDRLASPAEGAQSTFVDGIASVPSEMSFSSRRVRLSGKGRC